MAIETSEKALNMFGDKLYQQRARRALPMLVRQALSNQPIVYEALASELGMINPRNLNFVLGSVGRTLGELSATARWNKRKPPHLQSLVINKGTKLPGPGFDNFLGSRHSDYAGLTREQKRQYLMGYWQDIFAYPHWREVLDELGLMPATQDRKAIIDEAKNGRGRGGGEGAEHKALKNRILRNPELVGLDSSISGAAEQLLPSGDKLDLLFTADSLRTAVEVKSHISNHADIERGLFQCVKYRAVMEAERGFLSEDYQTSVVLALGRKFPERLEPLKNSLGVTAWVIAD